MRIGSIPTPIARAPDPPSVRSYAPLRSRAAYATICDIVHMSALGAGGEMSAMCATSDLVRFSTTLFTCLECAVRDSLNPVS